ncbi:DUF3526 domain-containing protein [Aliikangiella marina]|uniref:DUF3526 domain-containing protein n=1 Tax=Aliikangiella marina TaxID=1712262 RepID=A0A545TCW1_9GAMM|nr:DUF3526 domain-containing protein [Aliikangiella marina]TQV75055.1 DUF3526 domain-containing protein [Aliikangiella marina]
MMNHLSREWRFMFQQRYVVVLLLCSFLVSTFSIATGLTEVSEQRQTIERLKKADKIDRAEVQSKYDDPGMLAYYSFHLTYSEPSNLAFAALGERDTYPWKHRIRMLALEGQIYESDAQNAELAQAGKIDFAFVISALSPLLIILLFHDLFANERNGGRYDLLISTTRSSYAFWGARITVRVVALYLALLLPFYCGAYLSDASLFDVFQISFWCSVYFIFWVLLSVFWGRRSTSAPKVASRLIGIWVLFAFIIPILGNLLVNQLVNSPKGSEILLTQREAVNDAWDLPVETTMNAFIATHPNYEAHTEVGNSFEWKWYYAFQQVGDQVAAPLSQDYRKAGIKKHRLAGYVAFLSPPMFIQKRLSRLADTDAIAAIEYESQIRRFHHSLRLSYYPWLFSVEPFDKSLLNRLPTYEQSIKGPQELN